MKNTVRKVLIVEDDSFLAQAYTMALQQHDILVEQAKDGVAAMSAVQSFQPDVIVLDLLLPIKDGFQVLEELADDPSLKKIPVIVASNLGQESDIQRAKKLGARDYIVKSKTAIGDVTTKILSMV